MPVQRLSAALLLVLATAASAQTDGRYTLQGGAYAIDVQFTSDSLTVVEPNKTSVYQRQADGSYHFTNPNNGVTYGLRVIDERTIEAFKPGNASPPTRLTLAPSAAEEAPEGADQMMELAMSYNTRAQSDPDNAHVWSACGLAAMARATYSTADAEAKIRETSAMVKPIMVDAQTTPCPDAIPQHLW